MTCFLGWPGVEFFRTLRSSRDKHSPAWSSMVKTPYGRRAFARPSVVVYRRARLRPTATVWQPRFARARMRGFARCSVRGGSYVIRCVTDAQRARKRHAEAIAKHASAIAPLTYSRCGTASRGHTRARRKARRYNPPPPRALKHPPATDFSDTPGHGKLGGRVAYPLRRPLASDSLRGQPRPKNSSENSSG